LTAISPLTLHDALPIFMFSTLTEHGAAATLDALSLGASDYATKPSDTGSFPLAIERVRAELIPKIKALCGVATAESPVLSVARPDRKSTRLNSSHQIIS